MTRTYGKLGQHAFRLLSLVRFKRFHVWSFHGSKDSSWGLLGCDAGIKTQKTL